MSAVCPNCRAAIPEQATACPQCGAEFGEHSAWKPIVGPPPKPQGNLQEWLGVAPAILAILGWLTVLLGAAMSSLREIGTFELYFWGLNRSLSGIGPTLALIAACLAVLVAILSKGRQLPWTGFVLGAWLWLLA